MATPRESDADAIEQAVVAERFRTTIELHAVGLRLMRVGLTRRFPDESEQQIDQRIESWLREQPDHGPAFVDSTPARCRSILGPMPEQAA
ncbi:MAG: hypothetical protein AAGI54_02335 [Planctomycetota bacterium]